MAALTGSTAAARDAVVFLLTSPVLDGRCLPMLGGDEFNWPALLAETEQMSRGQRIVVYLAHDLWTAAGTVDAQELSRLDRDNFERAVVALRIHRGDEAVISVAA
jgi:hypothetical protein